MDIDIDLQTSFNPHNLFNVTNASIVENGELKKHLVGVYFQKCPIDRVTNLCAIPYDKAESFGLFKIDMLHLSVLDIFESKDEIKHLLKKKPDWSLLQHDINIAKCFHISRQADIVKKVNPTSVLELADVLALIRPGKLSLLDKYIKDPINARKILYAKTRKSDLRKSHAIPYALIIVMQLHLIKAGIL